MHVLVAPDSFKGTLSAARAAAAIAAGWRSVRPGDELVAMPLADGGEGSAEAIRDATPGGLEIARSVTGPDGAPIIAGWLLLPDGTAVVELAAASGLPLISAPIPLTAQTALTALTALTAQTTGFGELLAAATRHPDVRRIVATVGGSASTDGGTGALTALGCRFLDAVGRELPPGGGSLALLTTVDTSALIPPPAEGVLVLTDVTAPLTGTDGAAAVFGPQKGASPDDIATLDAGLTRLAAVIGGQPDAPGAGAAGGAAFGLVTLWSARAVAGATRLGEIVGLPAAVCAADLVITGEGRFDGQSSIGKVVGHLLQAADGRPVALVAGEIDAPLEAFTAAVCLTDLAGSPAAAMAEPERWLHEAGARLARLARRSGQAE